MIFEPVDHSIRKAIVIPSVSHNHPRHPHAKPTQKEKDFVKAASKASGRTKISAKKLRTSATTTSMLNPGECWESQLPAMVDDQRLRKFLKTINRETYPRGLGWEGQFDVFPRLINHSMFTFKGVLYTANNMEAKLPESERYIHTVTTKGDTRLVVTMHPLPRKAHPRCQIFSTRLHLQARPWRNERMGSCWFYSSV